MYNVVLYNKVQVQMEIYMYMNLDHLSVHKYHYTVYVKAGSNCLHVLMRL